MSPFGLSPSTLSALINVFTRWRGVEKVLIYGSRAKNTFREGSDIDLTLIGKNITTTDLLAIENEIEEALLPQKVDLSIFSKIENPELKKHIERVGLEFFRRN
jgi:predicted nucleotidyltransferase